MSKIQVPLGVAKIYADGHTLRWVFCHLSMAALETRMDDIFVGVARAVWQFNTFRTVF